MTLRLRLVLAAALAIVAAIAALGAAALVISDRELRAGVDDTLRGRAVEAARLSASTPALLTAPGALDAQLGGRLTAVEVIDRRGRVVARSASLGSELLPGTALAAAASRSGASRFADAKLAGEPLRLYAAPLADVGGAASGGAVLVASSTRDVESTLSRLRLLVGMAALVAALVGALAAAYLTGRGLRPLRRLSAAAAAIARTGDAKRRLPAPAARDEVGELAATLNAMLATLERARERERRFLADASHELRTPVTSLRGNAAYLARHGADAGAIADIEADATRLGRLVDDLLGLERADAAAAPEPLVPTRLDELAAQVAASEPQASVSRCDPVTVAADREALSRALGNLVENARVHGRGRIAVSVEHRADRALVSVEDEGEGIPPELVARAFERFWRGSGGERPGSGLGLAIVAAIAERHGGRVDVAGARFTLDLPALKELSRSDASVESVPAKERS